VLVVPSPKLHDQAVGLPADVSVNATVCPVVGELGLKVNDELRTDMLATVIVLLPCFVPELVLVLKATT